MHKFFSAPGKYRALDLGSGSGNETIDLLSRNWNVLGTDLSPRSGEVISQRAQQLGGRFQFQEGDFSTVRLNDYYDLVISFYSLPFGNKKDLPILITNLSCHMKSGAVIAVNFFGEKHDFVKHGKAYGITKSEINQLFDTNHFKIIYFLNRIYNQRDFDGNQIHWDILDIIAIKI